MHRIIVGFVAVAIMVGGAIAQDDPQPAQVTPAPVIVINTAPTAPERDKCEPLNARLDTDRCESLLATTRTIWMKVGTKRTLRFDRVFARIELDAVPERSIDAVPAESNTASILSAVRPGRAEIYFFGEGTINRGQNKIRDVLVAVTVIAIEQEPQPDIPPPPLPPLPPRPPAPLVHIHNSKGNLGASTVYECEEGGPCQRPPRPAPKKR